MQLNEIQMRDPFVYAENGYYYLYGSTDSDIWKQKGHGFNAYRSVDLINWEPLGNVFDRPQGYWGTVNFWAPEMHTYNGKYYLFASFKAEGVERGTAVLKSDSPAGPFRPWSERAVTPHEWSCLDGTLYVEEGKPYMVFCHEWTQIGDGEICAMPLTDDLSAPAGEPRVLFHASDAAWVKRIHHSSGIDGYITDGPFMYRTSGGKLIMLWSSISESGYAIAYAQSDNSSIFGNWTQGQPLFESDGGHGMLFKTYDGKLLLTIHTPNKTPLERPIFIEIDEAKL